MSRVCASVTLVAILGFVATLPAADLLYTTGEPLGITVIADGTMTNGGYISGFLDAVSFGRYTATAFTLTDDVNIEETVVYWFDDSDNPALLPTDTLEWIIYADDAGGGPGSVVASGSLPYADVVSEEWIDPIFTLTTDWKRRLPLVTSLSAGTYWISFHGIEGSIGWLTGAADGGDDLYRATSGTNYTLYTNTIWETPDDPDRVYHVAFDLYGTVETEPVCEGDANGDNVVDPLDSGFVLSRFGCDVSEPDCAAADVNLDGVVDPLDAGFVLSRFGDCPSGLTATGPDVMVAPVRTLVKLPHQSVPNTTNAID